MALRRGRHQRRGSLKSGCSGFVAVGVFEENPVTAAYSSLAVAFRIPGKTYAWRRIEKVTRVASDRRSFYPALNQSIKWIAGNAAIGIDRAGACDVCRRIKV